jgi:acetate kinase
MPCQRMSRSIAIDRAVLATLERYVSLAPLHQPNRLP